MIRLKFMTDTDTIWQIANKWPQLFTGRLLPLPPVTQRLGGGCIGAGGAGGGQSQLSQAEGGVTAPNKSPVYHRATS